MRRGLNRVSDSPAPWLGSRDGRRRDYNRGNFAPETATIMNILNAVYGDSTGGRWSATLKTARLLADKGHTVTLLIDPADLPNVPAGFVGPRIKVETLANSGHYDLIASWRASRLIRARSIDAVIGHSGRAIYMLKRAAPEGVPVIAFNHSHNIKRTLKADAFFCITPYMKQIVDAATGGAKPSFVISNAVSIPPEETLADPAGGVFSIGAIGRMVPNKGFRHLLDALAQLGADGVAFRAQLAGDGEDRAALQQQARELGIADRVEFPGWLDPAGKQAFFNSLDVVCFTSEWETQGIVILESFAWRKALIGTNIDGPSSCYVDGETALVVPPADPVALAAALRRLHDDPVLRHRLAVNGRNEAIRRYSNEAISELLDRSIGRLVAEARKGRAG